MNFIVIQEYETGLWINLNLSTVISFHYDPELDQTLFIVPGLEEIIHAKGDITGQVRKTIAAHNGICAKLEAANNGTV